MKNLSPILLLLLFVSCSNLGGGSSLPDGVECLSLTGAELRPPTLTEERREELLANLEAAQSDLAANPGDEMATIWVGRRLGYLGRYNEAIEVYSQGLEDHPDSYRLHRHRGHRYISLRRFDEAIGDLSLASILAEGVPDEYEKDGAPNAHGIPRSTTHSNIYYHLALAEYLVGNFEASLQAWKRCEYFSRVNDDMLVATSYWTVLTLWRMDRRGDAKKLLATINAEMDVIENHDYHRLLLLFKGELEESEFDSAFEATELSSATVGYGLGMWHWQAGRSEQAREFFQRVVDETFWPAFGHIASEVELAGH